MSAPNEQVLVFPAHLLAPWLPHFNNGIITDQGIVRSILADVLAPGATHYMDRAAAEANPDFKQVIPYCVLTKPVLRRDGRSAHYFAYSRTKKGGEGRLHDKWSVGVGGHINPVDGDDSSNYGEALSRELYEEVSVKLDPVAAAQTPVLGVIYDDSNEVGRVHFGVAHLIGLDEDAVVRSSDPALSNGGFMSAAGISGLFDDDKFENWSKLVVGALGLGR